MRLFENRTWGGGDSIVGKALARHMVNLGSILDTVLGLMNPVRGDPLAQIQE